jgi:serine phosphatase RsbU (regulator of sigma subunit)
LILMGFYHLFLFNLRKKENSVLLFAVLCFIVPLRVITTSENYIVSLFPTISWDWKYRIEYISIFLIVPFMYAFFRAVFPLDVPRLITKLLYVVAFSLSAITLFTSPNTFTYLLLPNYAAALLAMSFGVYGLIKALINKRAGASLFVLGALFMILTAINDILHSAVIINTYYIVPLGFFVFFFSQAALLSMRFSHAFTQVENLSGELKVYNENLESVVAQRTAALQDVNHELHQTIQVINDQKADIEHKSKEITASITYAKRIQSAILSKVESVQHDLSSSFIFFKPRDIVSGDFYWFAKKTEGKENKVIVVAADCTGHGVPGAFMSMIGDSLLNQIVHDRAIYSPEQILYELHKGVTYLLNQQHTQNRDSMHISIAVIDLNKHQLEFSGAKSGIIYFQNEQLFEIKGDKTSIGDVLESKFHDRNFNKHTIPLPSLNGQPQAKTTFYLFSDGYIDQFGGKENKRFSRLKLRELLNEIHQKPMQEQKEVLEQNLLAWMQEGRSSKQIDDILVIGVQV